LPITIFSHCRQPAGQFGQLPGLLTEVGYLCRKLRNFPFTPRQRTQQGLGSHTPYRQSS
jgi:hypothetical protein